MLAALALALCALAFAIYVALDGFALGAGMLVPWLAAEDHARRNCHAALGPLWTGREAWLVVAAGLLYGTFPRAAGLAAAAFYTPLAWLAGALILRAAALAFRSRVDDGQWRGAWDAALTASSGAGALMLGLLAVNVPRGLPLDRDGIFMGHLATMFGLAGTLGSVAFALALAHHGALWLAHRVDGAPATRAALFARRLRPAVALAAAAYLAASWWRAAPHGAALFFLPLAAGAACAFALAWRHASRGAPAAAWRASAAALVLAVLWGAAAMWPNVLASTFEPTSSLTVHNASASAWSQAIVVLTALATMPLLVALQWWIHRHVVCERLEERDEVVDLTLG